MYDEPNASSEQSTPEPWERTYVGEMEEDWVTMVALISWFVLLIVLYAGMLIRRVSGAHELLATHADR